MKHFFIILSLIPFFLHAQSGGRYVYSFLQVPSSARAASLGGDFFPVNDNDISLVLATPALNNKELSNGMSLGYVNYFAGVNSGVLSYVRHVDKIGSLAMSVQYMNYGEFDLADETGLRDGVFHASDVAIVLGLARTLSPHFSLGINIKPVFSTLETYQSGALLSDVSAVYSHKDKGVCAALTFKNMGGQLYAYVDREKEVLPFEIEMGVSKKLAHAPLRLVLLLNDLQQFDLSYGYQEEQSLVNLVDTVDVTPSSFKKYSDILFRHVVLGGEFVLADKFYLRLGYNYKRRQEMKEASRKGVVGITWGLGVRVSKFQVSYSRSIFHLAGASNYFTLSTSLNEFKKSKK